MSPTRTPCFWLWPSSRPQVKLLRLLRLLGKGDAHSSDVMSDILAQVRLGMARCGLAAAGCFSCR